MKKGKSKFLALCLALIMLVGIAGCGKKSETETEVKQGDATQTETTTDGTTTESTATTEEIDTSEFVELTMLVLGNVPTNGQLEKVQEEWNKILKEEINATLTLKWIEWADWLTKYNLTLASGEPIDIITTGDWLDMWTNVQRGAFLPITDLVDTYMPKTAAEITPEEWDVCKYEDEIYFLPENDYTQYVNHGFLYRGDLAKEFGIDQISDYDTLGKYFQGIKDNYPDMVPWDANGSNPELFNGWVTSNTDALQLLFMSTGYHAAVWAESYDNRFEVVSPIFDDTFIDFTKKMKEWSQAGYWREDVLVYTGDTQELFKAGLSGAHQHHTQTFRGLRYKMDEAIPGSEVGFFPFSATRQNLMKTPILHGASAIGAYSENPERALMAYEIIRQNEDFYRLLNYGMEGVQYEINDGKMVRPEGYDETNDGFYSDFWGGRVDKFELPTETEYAGIYDLWAEFDSYAKPDPYSQFVFDRTPVEAELAAISDVTSSMGPKFNWGYVEDVEAEVAEYRDKLTKAGIDKVLEEVERQLQEYKTKLGE